jgi:ADP-ribose diphosphatase
MPEKPRILATRDLVSTRLFRVQEIDLEFANGNRVTYERLLSSPRGAVLVVPLLDDDTLLLIREYAGGTDRYELAFPKGLVEEGEDPCSAANRELQEEAGYAAHELKLLTSFTIAPGHHAHVTHVVLASGLYASKLDGDEPEEIEVVTWRWQHLHELLARKDFTEARSVAALFMAREYLQQGWHHE